MKKTKSASKSEAGSSREAKIQENQLPQIPGKGKIAEAIILENDLTGNAFAFPMKMFMCYRTLAEAMLQRGDVSETRIQEAIGALGSLTEAAMYECGAFSEHDIYVCE